MKILSQSVKLESVTENPERLIEKHGGYGKDVELHHYSVKRPF